MARGGNLPGIMLRIRREQVLALQADLDATALVAFFVEQYRDAAAEDGLHGEDLVERVRDAVGLGRRLDARKVDELASIVALSVFVDPGWASWEPCARVLRQRQGSLEAKLHYIEAQLMTLEEAN